MSSLPPTSPMRRIRTLEPESEDGRRFQEIAAPTAMDYLGRDPITGSAPGEKALVSIHANHGQHRHCGGRWKSTFTNLERDSNVGTLRRKLEALERDGKHGRAQQEPWAVRVKLVETYVARALTLLRGSGFVEAYHLLQASLELSLYDRESGSLCTGEKGLGALPRARGTRLTALVLNNLGCYHRRRGQGRSSLHFLRLAEEIEGEDAAVSTQINLCLLTTELGMLKAALAHAKTALRRCANEVKARLRQPTERAAIIAVTIFNLGVALDWTPRAALRESGVDLEAARWCFDAAEELARQACLLGATRQCWLF